MEQQTKLSEEMKKMEYEPLLPVELKLVRWSIGIGVGSLFFPVLAEPGAFSRRPLNISKRPLKT